MTESHSFFDRDNIQKEIIQVGGGIPFGIESVTNSVLGVGGAYGSWGETYDNTRLLNEFVTHRMGAPLEENEKMNLGELGFLSRHHIPDLTDEEHIAVELRVGARILEEAARANNWDPSEVDAVLI